MKARDIHKKYLEFFKSKNHAILPSSSLIPENDPTVLFTTAGMHPLVPFLLGQPHPQGKRVASLQKCIRTGDIEEVGDDTHVTLIEMLGNWSLGDYFKKEAIEMSYEFLTSKKYLGIEKEKIAITCFLGDKDCPKDVESEKLWLALGIPKERIVFLGKEDNWWGPAGKTGPCGPDTEMFYWFGKEPAPKKFNPKDKNWVEIWNDVFMQYNKNEQGKFVPLKQKNVDTGMGLERTAAILQGKSSVYESDLFLPIMNKINLLSKKQDITSERIIADHVRAATFILAEKIPPSNVEQGYVLRRLIRRALRHARLLEIESSLTEISKVIIKEYSQYYPELNKNKKFILEELEKEESKFKLTLEKGVKLFERELQVMQGKTISGKIAFDLYQSCGFPLEITKELAQEKKLKVEEGEFSRLLKEHQELSKKSAEGRFTSGLADHGLQTRRLHTATHLLHQALRIVLGNHVQQKGSNITQERLRFDFSNQEKLTEQQLKQVEKIVNEQIQAELEVTYQEMPLEQAKKLGALHFFDQKYPEKIRVYSVGKFSKEFCSGPHVENTAQLGKFKIQKEEAVAAGVRRIKAGLE
ncbi:MAG TPA: alanine--tRNA ligase [Candidatus Nanoarchaeia archaeon]|nr:alanine--tRNA ligase [Candidatus Nanoarchaeia archaeon]